ncbi:DUF3768 domain-containing protein [Sphingomonas sp. LB-2]|uniref:DUF3768 domain-containing protein n=1 Tax=Sphingomonas caeni TaxID=2984949 RepID=UPI00222E81F1|nr:DUF3768 domain-containing protein [Sphingomonas caeni]MCW3847361.1 DUF3768 domain-containing protein [Sphingomonas caeni]
MSRPTTIAALNDAMRSAGPLAPGHDQWMITAGVTDRGKRFTLSALMEVIHFDGFTPINDPYAEHDFGAFEIDGLRLCWKIDYYDLALEYGSPDRPIPPSHVAS